MNEPTTEKAYRPEGYTEADRRSDTSFLVGVRFGREQERAALLASIRSRTVEILREHLPRDRYDDDGHSVGTFCTCGTWEGDYFADGDAGPFDEHLADALILTTSPGEAGAS